MPPSIIPLARAWTNSFAVQGEQPAKGFGRASQAQRDLAEDLVQQIGNAVPREQKRTLMAAPVLTAPVTDATLLGRLASPSETSPYKGEAGLTRLIGEMRELFGEVSQAQLKQSIKAYCDRSAANQARFLQLNSEWDDAKLKHEVDLAAATEAATEMEAQLGASEEASREVERIIRELAAAEEGTPEHDVLTRQLGAAKATQAAAETAALHAGEKLLAANEKALASGAASAAINDHINELLKEVPASSPRGDLKGVAAMQYLISVMQEVLSKITVDGMRESLAMQKVRLEAQRIESQKRAEEAAEAARKAAENAATGSCVGKWIARIVTVVSGVLAFVTGGIALPLAALAVGLLITSETTGEDPLAKALSPVISKVMSALTEVIASVTRKLFGEEAGAIVAAALAAVILVVAVIVAFLLVKSAATKLMEKVGPRIMQSISKLVPQLAKQAAKSIKEAPTRLQIWAAAITGASSSTRAAVSTGAGVVPVAMQTAQQGVAIGYQVHGANLNVKLQKAAVEIQQALMRSELLSEQNTALLDAVQEQLEMIQETMMTFMTALQQRTSALMLLPNHMRA